MNYKDIKASQRVCWKCFFLLFCLKKERIMRGVRVTNVTNVTEVTQAFQAVKDGKSTGAQIALISQRPLSDLFAGLKAVEKKGKIAMGEKAKIEQLLTFIEGSSLPVEVKAALAVEALTRDTDLEASRAELTKGEPKSAGAVNWQALKDAAGAVSLDLSDNPEVSIVPSKKAKTLLETMAAFIQSEQAAKKPSNRAKQLVQLTGYFTLEMKARTQEAQAVITSLKEAKAEIEEVIANDEGLTLEVLAQEYEEKSMKNEAIIGAFREMLGDDFQGSRPRMDALQEEVAGLFKGVQDEYKAITGALRNLKDQTVGLEEVPAAAAAAGGGGAGAAAAGGGGAGAAAGGSAAAAPIAPSATPQEHLAAALNLRANMEQVRRSIHHQTAAAEAEAKAAAMPQALMTRENVSDLQTSLKGGKVARVLADYNEVVAKEAEIDELVESFPEQAKVHLVEEATKASSNLHNLPALVTAALEGTEGSWLLELKSKVEALNVLLYRVGVLAKGLKEAEAAPVRHETRFGRPLSSSSSSSTGSGEGGGSRSPSVSSEEGGGGGGAGRTSPAPSVEPRRERSASLTGPPQGMSTGADGPRTPGERGRSNSV
jgi:hypothetical protein